jgi:DNA invertase Pin-like site-specific DNA recombinase
MKFGYCRVSSFKQQENFSLEVQYENLKNQGISEENIRKEVGSGTTMERPVLQSLLSECRAGDYIYVLRLDRFARSTLEALNTIAELEQRGVSLVSLDLPECSNPMFREFFRSVILFFASFETKQRKERQREGILKAKAAGKYKGRKAVITEEKIKRLQELLEQESLSKKEMMSVLGFSRTTFYRAIKQLETVRN